MTRSRGRTGCLSRTSFLGINVGLPTGREPYGNGASVVVRGQESRLHGEGRQVFKTPKYGGMRNADSRRSIERHQETRNYSRRTLESRMMGNCQVRFGGEPMEKWPSRQLASGLPYSAFAARSMGSRGAAVPGTRGMLATSG